MYFAKTIADFIQYLNYTAKVTYFIEIPKFSSIKLKNRTI